VAPVRVLCNFGLRGGAVELAGVVQVDLEDVTGDPGTTPVHRLASRVVLIKGTECRHLMPSIMLASRCLRLPPDKMSAAFLLSWNVANAVSALCEITPGVATA